MEKMILAGLMLITGTSFAATSADLVITGFITAVSDLVIVANANATTLNIIGGETSKLVALVTETSNNLTGYQILMRSANSSKLVNSLNPSKSADYKISYDGGAELSLSRADVSVKNVSTLPSLTTVSSGVNVSVIPYATAPAGTYSDTITISIIANN